MSEFQTFSYHHGLLLTAHAHNKAISLFGAEKTETQLEYSAFWCLLGQVTTSAPKDAGRLAREFLKGQEDS